MKSIKKPTTITLHLAVPKRDDAGQAWRRIRAALKGLWRSYGLRCQRITFDGVEITAERITSTEAEP